MPRMQVYLAEDLYKAVKAAGLPVSELLQQAVRAELRRRELLVETDRYLRELEAEVGKPRRSERARATERARRLAGRPARKVG